MKNKLLLDALREVRHTYSRFLSILVLAALAVAFLAGLRATQPDMEWTVDRYFDRQKLMDVRVVSTLGLTPEDITALDAEEGVAAAEGAWTVDAMIAAGDKEHVVKLHSLSKNGLNAPVLREGRLPEDVSECVTEERFLQASGLKLGDRVTMNTGDGAFEEALVRQEFTIVGVADSPLYLFDAQRGTSSLGTGRVSAFFLLEEEAFDMDFTDAYLLLDGADTLVCYSDAYDNMAEDAMDGLEPLGDVRAPLRREELVATANEKLDDAQKEYDDAKAEADDKIATAEADLADARKKLDDAQRELDDGYVTLARESADGQQELDDAAVKLTDARLTLDENEVKYRDGVVELADGKTELADAEKKLADAKLELEDGKKELDDAKKELDDAKQKLEDGKKEYADGLQTFTEKKQEFEDGKAEYEKGVKEYEDGKGKYEDGLKEYQDAKVTLDDAKKELDKAEGKLKKAKEQLAAGSAEYDRGVAEYNRQKAAFDGSVAPLAALFGQSSGDALFGALDAAEQAGSLGAMISGVWGGIDAQRQQLLGIINAPVGTPGITDEMRQQAEAGLKQLPESQGALEGLVAQARGGNAQLTAAKGQLDAGGAALSSGSGAYQAGKLEYQKGKAEYEDGLKKWQESAVTLQDARDELDKGALKLADAKAALSDGQRQLDDAEVELADAKKELADGERKYAEGETKYRDGVTEYQDGLAEYEDGAAEYADGAAEIADAERELVDARQKLDDGTREYNDGKAEYEDGVLTLAKETAKAKRKLADGELELRDGEKDYAKGYAEYLDGKDEAEEKLFDARQKLGDARHKIADIEDCEWYFLGRKTNAGFVSYQNDAERIGNLASVFPIIFFLVAALVCLTTMTRMVEEQRVQIGGMKALGYSRGQIAFKYVGYGFSASLLGGIAGLAMGLTVIPTIIYNAWGTLYTLPPLRLEFVPAVSLMSLGAAVVTVTGAALAASFGVLSAVPAELMRPKAPAAGKRVLLERITPLWKRLSFSLKVAVRNLFRYKKRFWMTVIGIG
ncbi:MAG: FtsX-like permease family protein, partial [Oscillospiraceae bacterium]